MKKNTNKFNKLCEDITMMAGSNQHGMGSRDMQPVQANLLDILSAYKKAKKKGSDNHNVTPYPIQVEPMVNDLGDLYLKAHQIGSKLRQANNSPLIENDKDMVKSLSSAFKKIVAIKKAIISISEDLGELQ
jgi:hypothetical protein